MRAEEYSMLCVNTYKKGYIEECRANTEAQLAAYRVLLTRDDPIST